MTNTEKQSNKSNKNIILTTQRHFHENQKNENNNNKT